MTAHRALATALLAMLAGPIAAQTAGTPFVDVLDAPSLQSPLSQRSLLQGLARTGGRLVAVGQRGHILVSTDAGTTWKQVPVPVSSDLTAVFFADAANGWAVGHDGVILHSGDGGETWQVQLTGNTANDLLVAAMQRKVAAEPGSDKAKALLDEANRYKAQGPDKPFLDVWFADASSGFAVGAYNLIFHTADGGKTWEPWFDRTDNPKFFNLYSIRPVAGQPYIAGEAGLVLKLDAAAGRFKQVAVPYNGSFFGVAEAGDAAIVFGLRGHIFRSGDGGATWTTIDAGLPAAVVAATRTAAGALLLADAGGRVVASTDGGQSFQNLAMKQPVPITGLAEAADGRIALVGPRGVVVAQTPAP